MEKNTLTEINRVCSNNSLLVTDKYGIYRLFCPFKAICVQKVEKYSIGQEITVIAVKMDNNFKIVYIIHNKAYYHHYFMIVHRPDPITYTNK